MLFSTYREKIELSIAFVVKHPLVKYDVVVDGRYRNSVTAFRHHGFCRSDGLLAQYVLFPTLRTVGFFQRVYDRFCTINADGISDIPFVICLCRDKCRAYYCTAIAWGVKIEL